MQRPDHVIYRVGIPDIGALRDLKDQAARVHLASADQLQQS